MVKKGVDKKIIWWIIGIVVIVVIAIFFIKYTGNVINVPSSTSTTQTGVYTKAEIDAQNTAVLKTIVDINKNVYRKIHVYNKSEIDLKLVGIGGGNVFDKLNVTTRLYTKDMIYQDGIFGEKTYPDFYGPGKPKVYSVVVGSMDIGVSSLGNGLRQGLAQLKDYQVGVETPEGSSYMNSGFIVLNKKVGTATISARYNADRIQMQSPDGTTWYCKPENSGFWNCTK